MIELEFVFRVLVSMSIGGLIGLERERHAGEKTVLAGIRTDALMAGSGAITAYLSESTSSDLVLIIGMLIAGAMAISIFALKHTTERTGITTPLAFYISFLLGLLAGFGGVTEAIIVAVVVTGVLAIKERTATIADIMTEEEMTGTVQLLILTFIIYPISIEVIPGGFDFLKIPETIMIVILVSVISFLSFLIMRVSKSRKELYIIGPLGGGVSAIATTVSMSNMRKKGLSVEFAVPAIILANSSSIIKNMVIIGFADSSLETLEATLIPLSIIFVGMVSTALLSKAARSHIEHPSVTNPFAIGPALKLGFIFLIITFFTHVLTDILGDAGAYMISLGGFVSSAGVALSVSLLVAGDELAPDVATVSIVLATIFAMASKLVIAKQYDDVTYKKLLTPLGINMVISTVVLLLILFL